MPPPEFVVDAEPTRLLLTSPVFQALRRSGPVGNFVLSLTGYAENGFFKNSVWVPVIASAFASRFLIAALLLPITRRFLDYSD